jgi:outer membrane biosynthesis protein TonB
MNPPLIAVRTMGAALALGACLCVRAQDAADVPLRLEGMEAWGRLTRAMAPNFPKELLASRASGHVDIVGRVNAIGMIEDVEIVPGNAESKAFVAPLSAVMEFWRFRVPVDNACQPVPTVIRNRVWIDLAGEQPRMRISVLEEPGREGSAIKPLHREEPQYPRSMARMAWQALVYASVDIEPSGKVLKVTSVAYPKKRGVDLTAFEEEVNHALARWTFPAAAEGRTRNRRVCYDVLFRLRD